MSLIELLAFGAMLCAAGSFAQAKEPAARAAMRVDPDVLDELRTTAIPAWESIERSLDSIDVYDHYTVSGHEDGKPVAPTRTPKYRVAWDREKRLALLRSEYAEYPDRIYHTVANGDYSFEVWGRVNEGRGELRGAKLADAESNPTEGDSPALHAFVGQMNAACGACRFISLPLRMLVDSPEFESVEAVDEQEKGARHIRFSARYLGEDGYSRRKLGIYTITIDPSMSYRLVRGRISFPDRDEELTLELTYHDAQDVFVPKILHSVQKHADHEGVSDWLTEFELPRKCDIPDEEFRLAFYGFDESVLVPLSPNRWLRWVLIACGVVSLAFGYWLLVRRSKSKA